jgi:hypothetical protein
MYRERLSIFIPIMNVKGLTMNITPPAFDMGLSRRATFSLDDAAGVRITCRRGSIWLTLDNDPRDVVLQSGDSFLTTEHRRAILYALDASCVNLAPVHTPAAAPVRTAPLRLAAAGLDLQQMPA